MKINNVGYLVKEGIRGIFLHGFMSFAAICVTVACLLIVGTFSCIMYNVNAVVDDLNKTNEVVVRIDRTLPLEDAKSVETKIRVLDNILSADFKSNEDALKEFVASQKNPQAYNGLEPKDFDHRVIVILEDNAMIEQSVQEIKAIAGVSGVSAAYELAQVFSTIQNVVRIASIVFIAVLLLVSLLIISNTVKLGMHERRDEIAIMKMVGATNGFIRLPFVVEGFTLGMVSAAASFGLEWLLYNWVCNQLAAEEMLSFIKLVSFSDELLVPMVITFVCAGMFVGVIGSWASIRKFMDV